MSTPELTGKQRRYLRSLGHHLDPIVLVGKEGVTEGVGKELAHALLDHELVKVRLLDSCPQDRDAAAASLEKACGAAIAGEVGHTLLFYKPHPEKPRIELPRSGAAR